MDRLHAGVARVDITPPPGLDLGGGAFGPARAILHPLAARALALRDGATAAILIACDLLGVDRAFADEVRSAIAARCSVPANGVLIACTHTHGAPATVGLREWGTPDPGYLAALRERLIAAATTAWAGLAPARLAAGAAPCPGIAANRRNLGGGVDDTVRALRIDHADGTPLAAVVNFACHPVTLHDLGVVTADFPLVVEQRVQLALGAVPVLYLTGACGDVNPAGFPERKGEALADEVGSAVAAAALTALSGARAVDADLGLGLAVADAPLQALPGDAELRALRAERLRLLTAMTAPDAWKASSHRSMIAWADAALALRAGGGGRASEPLPVHALRLGGAAIVALPCELFAEQGLRIQREARLAPLLVATLTNGCHGYIPSPAAFAAQAYEAVASRRFLAVQAFAPGVDEVVCRAARSALAVAGTQAAATASLGADR